MSIKIIKNFLSAEQIKLIDEKISKINWQDGKNTAHGLAKSVKENQQSVEPTAEMNQINKIILDQISNNNYIQSIIIPVNVIYPMLNSHIEGNFYGKHIDRPMRYLPKSQKYVRCDLSMTVFLSNPSEYEGGELVIYDGDSTNKVKLNKGDCVIYRSGQLHEVAKVTKGRRVCAVTWMQSAIRDEEQREIILDLLKLGNSLSEANIEIQNLVSKVRNNLTRKWTQF